MDRASHSRIVTLAPNLAELVFAAGAGEYLVGVSAYSNYPPETAGLPVVGDAFTIDQEVLALLKPDLLLAWQSGTPAHVVDELRRAGYIVETVRTQNLDDISAALRQIGELTGQRYYAAGAADEFENGLRRLQQRYGSSERIRVFYQVSKRPLYTVSSGHFVSELISLCGGQNVFADLEELAPGVDVEAVIDRDPEVMLADIEDTLSEPYPIGGPAEDYRSLARALKPTQYRIEAAARLSPGDPRVAESSARLGRRYADVSRELIELGELASARSLLDEASNLAVSAPELDALRTLLKTMQNSAVPPEEKPIIEQIY